MDQKKMKQLRDQLLAEKRLIEERHESNDRYDLDHSMAESITEFSMYDNHPADIGTELFERQKDISLYHLDRENLREIEQALERMDEGTYGICTVCGQPIDEQRLLARPQALTCVEHAPADNLNEQRPIEEEFLQPPFGRTSLDERDDANQFDGEDAWQIVAAWGTSSTPFAFADSNKTDYNQMYEEAGEADGYVEPVEQIAYTELEGYEGTESVHFMRSDTYDEYMEKQEGVGNLIDYEQYVKERSGQDRKDEL